MSKKIFSKIITLLLFINILIPNAAYAQTILYEQKNSDIVTRGVTHEQIKRFTDSGWLNINVLRVNLKDSYINVDTIFSKSGFVNRSPVLKMAEDSGAIAAINGDFFSPKPGTNLAHSVGPVVSGGKLVSTPVDKENKSIYSVFSLDKNNNPLYSFWSKRITLMAPNRQSMVVQDINKLGWFTQLFVYDRNWGTKSFGKSDDFPTLTEMVVVDDKVQSINVSQGPVNIPENGYIVCGDYSAGDFLKYNFKVGDKVKLTTSIIPNTRNIKMALGGGAVLVKNGTMPQFSHDIPGLHPRTALGTTKDNKQMLLVTVDGRQIESIGMTQQDLAKLMLELGAYNAINFDGGGSTTMVTRNSETTSLEVVNNLSEPSERAVIDGVGVFTKAPKGTLSEISIKAIDTNIFAETGRTFNVYGFDQYHNPIEINKDDIKWSSDISGKFEKNTFYPVSKGSGKVYAELNGIKASMAVNVLDYPVELVLNSKSFPISSSPQWFAVYGADKDGYRAFIELKDLKITPSNIVTIADNYLRNKSGKTGLVRVAYKDLYTYFVSGDASAGSSSPKVVLDSFEKNNNAFWSYPAEIGGNYELSNAFSQSGQYSGKLDFDFTNIAGTKAAYVRLNDDNGGYSISTNPISLSLSVYAPQNYNHEIKGELIDSNDQILRVTFAKSVDWTGWKNLSVTLPKDAAYPLKIRKLYVVDSNSEAQGKGILYLDDLTVMYKSTKKIVIPPSKQLDDYQKIDSELKGGTNSYKIDVLGKLQGSISSDDNQSLDKISRYINNESSYSVLMQNFVNPGTQADIYNGIFNKTEYKNSSFINISAKASANSIRLKDSKQWPLLFDALKNNTKDNVFIVIDTEINGDNGFYDINEAKLLNDTLSKYVKETNKNLWVLFSSDKASSYNLNGVKYIAVPPASLKARYNTYVQIVVNDNELTFQFKKVY